MFSDKIFSMVLKKEMSQYFKIDTQNKKTNTTNNKTKQTKQQQKTIEETTKREMK